MKKTYLFAFLYLLIAFPLLAAQATYPINVPFFQGNKQERSIQNFQSIVAGGPIKVIVTMGDTEKLVFEGDEDAIASLIVEVKGNTLIIRPQNSWGSWARKYHNKKIIAHVSAKTLRNLTMSGSGSILVNGVLRESSVTTTLSGSGSITAAIQASNYTATLSGSGYLNISGKASNATITLSGSGSLTKKGLTVNQVSAQLSGSGSIYLHAEDHIDAVISGSGSIHYSGKASIDKKVSGSGSVRKI